MPNWEGSTRRSRLPAEWYAIRQRVLRRDNSMCQWYTESYIDSDGNTVAITLCNAKATEVDHIIPNDDHSMNNLRSLCHMHHQRKSSIEGAKALAAKRKALKRKGESHPGFL